MKRQIWLRPDQADLVAACLMYTQQQLNTGTCISDAPNTRALPTASAQKEE